MARVEDASDWPSTMIHVRTTDGVFTLIDAEAWEQAMRDFLATHHLVLLCEPTQDGFQVTGRMVPNGRHGEGDDR